MPPAMTGMVLITHYLVGLDWTTYGIPGDEHAVPAPISANEQEKQHDRP